MQNFAAVLTFYGGRVKGKYSVIIYNGCKAYHGIESPLLFTSDVIAIIAFAAGDQPATQEP